MILLNSLTFFAFAVSRTEFDSLASEANFLLAKREFNGIIHVQPSVLRINSFSRSISLSWNQALRFLYSDDCKITADNAIGVLYLAKKYLISSLTEKCCEIVEASIRPENVFVVLEQAIQFDEKELEEKSWDIVSKKTQECLNSEAFCDIELHTLNALLKKERLAVTEVDCSKHC